MVHVHVLYVTTSTVQADLSQFGCGCNHFPSDYQVLFKFDDVHNVIPVHDSPTLKHLHVHVVFFDLLGPP